MFDRKASSDKKPRPKTNFLSIKLYICKKPFKVNTAKEVAKIYIKIMFKIW